MRVCSRDGRDCIRAGCVFTLNTGVCASDRRVRSMDVRDCVVVARGRI